jgi:hypothetical protein
MLVLDLWQRVQNYCEVSFQIVLRFSVSILYTASISNRYCCIFSDFLTASMCRIQFFRCSSTIGLTNLCRRLVLLAVKMLLRPCTSLGNRLIFCQFRLSPPEADGQVVRQTQTLKPYFRTVNTPNDL